MSFKVGDFVLLKKPKNDDWSDEWEIMNVLKFPDHEILELKQYDKFICIDSDCVKPLEEEE